MRGVQIDLAVALGRQFIEAFARQLPRPRQISVPRKSQRFLLTQPSAVQPLGNGRRPFVVQQVLKGRRQYSEVTKQRAGQKCQRAEEHKGRRKLSFFGVKTRRNKAPQLAQDHRRGEEQAAIEPDLHQDVDLLDPRRVDQRPTRRRQCVEHRPHQNSEDPLRVHQRQDPEHQHSDHAAKQALSQLPKVTH